jgi:putative colanic acid biosynthesis UDP-glucose lipid carrier transferase
MKVLSATSSNQRSSERTGDLLGRLRLSYEDFSIIAMLSDTCAVVTASVATGWLYHQFAFGRVDSLGDFLGWGIVLAALTTALMQLKGLYTPDRLLSLRSQISPIMLNWSAVLLVFLGASFTLKVSGDLSRGWALSFAAAAPLLLVCQRLVLRRAMLDFLASGWLKRHKVIIITTDAKAIPAAHEMHQRVYDIVGTYVLPRSQDASRAMLRKIVSALRGSSINEIHLAIDWSRWPDAKKALDELRALPLPVRLVADPTAREILLHPQQRLCGAATFELQRAPLTRGERAAKRILDIVLAAVGVVVMAPFLLALSLLVWIESPGPILFRQTRGGFNGRAFQILKFRTMRVMEDGSTIAQATREDDRVTRIGRWLRRTSMDELPQLINVLLGDMSLVGPRPHALAHDEQYSKLISSYPFRHHMKPGITGWAQVNGFRGETPTVSLMAQRVELDLWYVSNWNPWLDLRILMWTALVFFRSRNAF